MGMARSRNYLARASQRRRRIDSRISREILALEAVRRSELINARSPSITDAGIKSRGIEKRHDLRANESSRTLGTIVQLERDQRTRRRFLVEENSICPMITGRRARTKVASD